MGMPLEGVKNPSARATEWQQASKHVGARLKDAVNRGELQQEPAKFMQQAERELREFARKDPTVAALLEQMQSISQSFDPNKAAKMLAVLERLNNLTF